MTAATRPAPSPSPASTWEVRADWRDSMPWLLLLRVTRIALDPRLLLLGAVGLILMIGGWWALGRIFGNTDNPAAQEAIRLLGGGTWSLRAAAPSTATLQADVPGGISGASTVYLPGGRWLPLSPFIGSWHLLSRPFHHALNPGLDVVGFTYALLCGLWGIAVWSIFGASICRIAAVRLARDERVTLGAALKHAAAKYGSYFWAPVFPLTGVVLVALPVAALGWLFRFDAGIMALSLLWPLCLFAGLLMTIFLVGLYFGWPLMWATISTEGTDSFDALSRTYAYVYQRPLHFAFYALVVTAVGWLAAIVVQMFAFGVVYLSLWSVSWTSGAWRIESIEAALPQLGTEFEWFDPRVLALTNVPTEQPAEVSTAGQIGLSILAFWIGCVRFLALGFGIAYFWTASTGIYLLLRSSVDNTEVDAVFLEGEQSHYGLPPLKRDAAGVPVVAEEESVAEAEESRSASVERSSTGEQ